MDSLLSVLIGSFCNTVSAMVKKNR